MEQTAAMRICCKQYLAHWTFCGSWVGQRGKATTWNGANCCTAKTAQLSDARANISGAGLGALAQPDWVRCVHRLVQQTATASFGGPNAYSWGLLAGGCVDVIVDEHRGDVLVNVSRMRN